jgi:hypothetical protein
MNSFWSTVVKFESVIDESCYLQETKTFQQETKKDSDNLHKDSWNQEELAGDQNIFLLLKKESRQELDH